MYIGEALMLFSVVALGTTVSLIFIILGVWMMFNTGWLGILGVVPSLAGTMLLGMLLDELGI